MNDIIEKIKLNEYVNEADFARHIDQSVSNLLYMPEIIKNKYAEEF
jgi:hypothetical protein